MLIAKNGDYLLDIVWQVDCMTKHNSNCFCLQLNTRQEHLMVRFGEYLFGKPKIALNI